MGRPLPLSAFVATSIAATLVPIPVHAQVTGYADRASFVAAASGLTDIDFAAAVNATGNGSTDYSTAAGLSLSGVTFTGPVDTGGSYLAVIEPRFFPTYQGWTGTPVVLQGPRNDATGGPAGLGPGQITVTLPAGINAVAFDLYTVATGDSGANTVSPVAVTLSTGESFTVQTFSNTATPDLAFVGFSASAPIASFSVRAVSPSGGQTPTYPNLSRFAFGTAAAVPEPGALGFAGAGCFAAALAARHCRRRAAR